MNPNAVLSNLNPRHGCIRSFVVILLLFAAAQPLTAQLPPPMVLPVETLQVESDSATQKQVAALLDLIRAGQFPEVVTQLRKLPEGRSEKFVAVTPNRYVTVATYAEMLAAALPPEGLRLYREQVDPVARPLMEAARQDRSVAGLKRVIQTGFAGSLADEAINALAEIAWENGEIEQARGYWEQLIPPRPQKEFKPPVVLAYPDTDLDLAQIRARLVLSSIFLREFPRAEREWQAFTRLHPQAQGKLGGNSGAWSELLGNTLTEARRWDRRETPSETLTFAGNAERNGLIRTGEDVGSPLWSTELTGTLPLFRGRRIPILKEWTLSTFPIVQQRKVFWADDESVYGCDLLTGKPIWPAADSSDLKIYSSPLLPPPARKEEIKEDDVARFREMMIPEERVSLMGVPQYTLTWGDGKLFARLHAPTRTSGLSTGVGEPSRLVCLDVERGEGKLLWQREAGDLKQDGLSWSFEGTPVYDKGRVYVGVRSRGAQNWSAIECLSADSGEPQWFRKLGMLQSQGGGERLGRGLVTVAGERLYYDTGANGVACLQGENGFVRWISQGSKSTLEGMTDPARLRWDRGTHLVLHHGMLFGLKQDRSAVLAWDGETGLLRWERNLGGIAQDLLGCRGGKVLVSGSRLWGLDSETGKLAWEIGSRDVEDQTYGRGLVSETQVLWPTREELLCVDLQSGAMQRRIPLQGVWQLTGGHLSWGHGILLIAQSQKLTAIPLFRGLKSTRDVEVSLRKEGLTPRN